MSNNFSPLELSSDFKYALDCMENYSDTLYITGKAGTGKSTLLKLFKNTTRKKTAVLAPTGLAALQVRGQTIHSFFGFPPKLILREDIRKKRNYRLYQNVEMIIIDEVSMVRADMMDAIDWFLRINRMRDTAFGGVQMVFFGDLYQLPPIISRKEEYQYIQKRYESPYFFSSQVLKQVKLEVITLQKIYRQDEKRFIRLLDNIRTLEFDYDDLEDLNQRYFPEMPVEDHYVTLSPRNMVVNSINQKKLNEINEIELQFSASVAGEFNPSLCPADMVLRLKRGAQVMFVKNDPDKRFVNGTIGKIIELTENSIRVEIEKDAETQEIEVSRLKWEIIKYSYNEKEDKLESDVRGSFEQYPLKLAWAITIHKSQGQTFDKVIIDMGKGAFEYGQTYVALSRCKTFEGILLKKPITPSDIKIDPRIVDFHMGLR